MDELRFEDDRDDGPAEEEKKGIGGLVAAILAILAALAALYYFVFVKKPGKPAPGPALAAENVLPSGDAGLPASPAGEPLAFPAVALGESDPAVREFAAALSADPEFVRWLLSKDLLRKFVVSVDNVANGLSPKSHIDFFAPKGDFRVARTKQGTFVDPAAYARYNAVVGVVLSLDAAAAARLYRAAKPLLQEAYVELGYPGVDFDDTLVRAMGELLETPVVDGPVRLEPKVLSYAMTEEILEGLSAAQKQLLRLGPKGVAAAQAKIGEIAAAMGIAASRLPKPRSYTTAVK